MTIFRPALETDLRSMYEVWYQNELLESPDAPEPCAIPSYMRHVLQTGTMFVAEQDGEISGFAGAITRGNVTFLTDLFIHPTRQSGQLGKTLLHSVLLQDDLIHCTMSSSDLRALALYIRAGMRPQWPHFGLRLEKRLWPKTLDIETIEADPTDDAFIRWDAQISGRLRPEEHLYWVREQGAIPLWFRRHRQIVGYGYIRRAAGTLWHPHAWTLGPIGVSKSEDAVACVMAAVGQALDLSDVIRIDVPGPHPCLPILLENGFRIISVDTFVSSAETPFFDAQRYIASGEDLL